MLPELDIVQLVCYHSAAVHRVLLLVREEKSS